MTVTLGQNVMSLRSQRQLFRTGQELSSVFERLSSGQRINRASDDAAGLAIATSLRTDARVYTQSVRNINDGISLVNIAEGAIQQMSDVLTRISELAEQAANGVYTSEQRAALDSEAQALAAEYVRISDSTTFNGIELFSTDLGPIVIEAGVPQNTELQIDLSGIASRVAGDGTFQDAVSYTGERGVDSQALYDFDGNGTLDLIQANTGPNEITWISGNGDGTFGSRVELSTFSNPQDLEIGDFNGDGSMDVLVRSNGSDEYGIHFGNGNGTFQSITTLTASGTIKQITSGDFDGDGNLDIATSISTGNVEIQFGDGTGSFGSTVTITDANANDMNIGDFNNDGLIDIVTRDSSQDLKIHIQTGARNFSEAFSSTSANGTFRGLAVGDINNDGILDLLEVTGGNGSNKTTFTYFGNGNGTFQSSVSQEISEAIAPRNNILVDFNGDGNLDFIATNATDNDVEIYLGGGDGTFTQSDSLTGVTGGVAVGDLNGDGAIDLVVGGGSGVESQFNVFIANTRNVQGLASFSLQSQSEALEALELMKSTQEALLQNLGAIGAFQSRLSFAGANLQSTIENIRASESRIMDVDIALETSRLVRNQILQQAAASVLAQANQQPALALQLLS